MTPFRPRDHRTWRVKIPTRHGSWRDRSTGTRDKATANAMQRMVTELGPQGKRAWDLLEAVLAGQLSLGRLYDAYRDNQLDRLRAELNDLDLLPLVEHWQEWLKDRVKERAKYRGYVMTLAGEGPWRRSTLTAERVERWLTSLPVAGPTKRKYHAALSSFLGYVRSVGYIFSNPLDHLAPPPSSKALVEYLELPDVLRVIDHAPKPEAAVFAFLYSTGCDLMTALGLRRRDVDLESHEVRARGTKTANRDRVVLVEEWAWSHVESACKGLLPDAPLFPGLNRWTVSDVHREIVKRLGLYRRGIDIRGARHHFAVRMLRAGTPLEVVARSLGNTPGIVLKTYGRFIPTTEERRRWAERSVKRESV